MQKRIEAMGWFNIHYLPEQKTNGGFGAVLSNLGDSFLKLGQINREQEAIDIKKQQNDFEKERFAYQKEADKEDRAFKIKQQEISNDIARKKLDIDMINAKNTADYKKELAADRALKLSLLQDEKAQKTQDRLNSITAMRKLYPEQTKGLSDDEIIAVGNQIEKLYQSQKNAISNDDWVSVDKDFYNEYAADAKGNIKSTEKNGFVAKRSYVEGIRNSKNKAMYDDSF
ncbi:hypothetical protein [Campylobacter gastrosuis]|uniref:Uncharacterized protein n=1 Tax=Campylobacter gastrosuis TaxID=2974576 RepID=A0ABT7HT22_9BACT|nr:hypothetical protein [Campylobacter gastrosuis]MDL0089855.1 hypothetical protein [Campylobacter gastrosuis]